MERRAISSRSNKYIQALARRLVRSAVTPNQISAWSVAAALLTPVGLFLVDGPPGALVAIAGIQLRLLANVLDGLVALEGGKSTAVGALWNEFPDRIADSVILVSLGYAAQQPDVGWLCALLAALTAYVRVFGGALGLPQLFLGPMAKQHRMAVATVALLALAALPAHLGDLALELSLWAIAAGSLFTCWRRASFVAQQLRSKAQP